MIVSRLLTPYVPFLRRFGRTLTSSQISGDAYVMAALQAVLAEQNHPDLYGRPREFLFASLLKVWNAGKSHHAAGSNDNVNCKLGADYSLEQMSPLPRAVFLLRAVEGFSTAAIARMLHKTTAEVEILAERAGREIATGLCTDVLIIEPDPRVSTELQAFVASLGHRVIMTACTYREAVGAASQQLPGLLLADINLADGSSGLEAVNDIQRAGNVPAVFITAVPERVLLSKRPEPIFLITKPFRFETVRSIINHALFFNRRAALVERSAAIA